MAAWVLPGRCRGSCPSMDLPGLLGSCPVASWLLGAGPEEVPEQALGPEVEFSGPT